MKNFKIKFLIVLATLLCFSQAFASITVVKKQRTVTQEEGIINPIDDSYIKELEEQVILDPIAINDDVETIDEFKPVNQFDESQLIKRKLTSSEDDNQELEMPN